MKVKHIIAFIIFSWIILALGALFKLEHWTIAGPFLIIGTILECIALILGILKVLTMKEFKNFLDS